MAVISHERAGLIGRLTLATLRRLGVPSDKIVVFVEPGEIPAYRANVTVRLAQGELGMVENRNKMVRAFDPGTRVLSVDDDVADVKALNESGKFLPATSEEFSRLCEAGFAALDLWGAGLWGISPIHNDLWARNYPEIQVGLPSLEGPFFGFVAGQVDMDVSVGPFEDVERCCKVYSSGLNVVRFNRFTHFQVNSSKGGRTRYNACREVRMLEMQYPTLVEHVQGRLANQSPCRARVRPRSAAANPRSMREVDELRRTISTRQLPKLDLTIHGGAE